MLHFASNIYDAVRDVRDFVAAKRRKREPIRLNVRGVTRSPCKPKSLADFVNLRSGLRRSAHFGRASEHLDRLEHEIRARWGHGFPLPEEVVQESDCSIWIAWGGVTVRAFPGFLGSVIGGTAGEIKKGITPALLDAIHARALHIHPGRA